MNGPSSNETIVLDFLKMLEERQSSSEIERFYHPDIVQTEFPNFLTHRMVQRSFGELKEAAEKGKQVLEKENYDVQKLFSIDDTVILECIWRGTLAIPIGSLSAKSVMTAYFVQIFEFKEGKIYRQRNYDCFEPF